MPGSLPGTSGYTYAAEFSVDEALPTAPRRSDFDKPLINYTENFIGAPVGSPVPTGYYDRERAEWDGPQDGRVIKVVCEDERRQACRREGAGGPESGRRRAERQRLADLLRPGPGAVARADHALHPVGPQLALRPAARRAPAAAEGVRVDRTPTTPAARRAPIIGCETQTLGESRPVTGTAMTLNYSSDRTPGWKVDERSRSRSWARHPAAPEGHPAEDRRGGRADREALVRPQLPDHRRAPARTCRRSRPTSAYRSAGTASTPTAAAPGPRDGDDPVDLRLRVQLLRRRTTSSTRTSQPVRLRTRGLRRPLVVRQPLGHVDTHFFCGIPIGQTITRAIGSWDARPTASVAGR